MVDVECESGGRAAAPGTRVFSVSQSPRIVVVLAGDPSPRQLGRVVGPAAETISYHLLSNVAGFSGTVVSSATGNIQSVRIGEA